MRSKEDIRRELTSSLLSISVIHHLWIAILIHYLSIRHSEFGCLHHHTLCGLHIATLHSVKVGSIHLGGDERGRVVNS